jgi:UDP-N-acetylmuramate dehydrogenase
VDGASGRPLDRREPSGRRIGGAEVSRKHANFIVNAGDASAADIERLIHEIQDTVRSETGVCLEAEVRIVGDPVQ